MKASRAPSPGESALVRTAGDDSSERHVLSDLPPFTKTHLI